MSTVSPPRAAAAGAAPVAATQLSESVAGLFRCSVVAAELHIEAPGQCEDAQALAWARGLLSHDECRSVAHCSASRIVDFTAGRLCAHRALQALDVEGFSLLNAPDRQALWPPGICGSITHTDGYAAAVIGRLSEVGGLGLDCERIEAVGESLWGGICTAAELAQFAAWPASDRVRAAALCFVAKEAFYKAQFALCGERLQFDAVCIDLREAVLREGSFRVHPQRALRVQDALREPCSSAAWTGYFRCHAGYISAGVALPVV